MLSLSRRKEEEQRERKKRSKEENRKKINERRVRRRKIRGRKEGNVEGTRGVMGQAIRNVVFGTTRFTSVLRFFVI